MLIAILITWAWLTCGALATFLILRKESRITVADIQQVSVFIALGPVSLAIHGLCEFEEWFNKNRNKVIWERKK